MSLVYIYGSGECEQLGKFFNITPKGLGDEGPPEVKRARKLSIFDDGLAAR